MVPLGDPRLTDPVDVACAESGAGRWVGTSIWVYDFARDLPAGLRCTFTQEPVRREWFREGTEPAATDSPDGSLKARQARITAPVGGTILALDPDIPAGRQRVPFEARDVMPGQRWLLDGVVLGEAADFVLWAPEPGRHRLSVMAHDGRILDTVTFVVRGARLTPADDRDLSP